MSANIPETKLVSELLKPTGFNCPEDLTGKTFAEATSGGGGDVELEDNKSAAINVTAYTSPVVVNPTEGKDAMKKVTVTLTNIPVPGATLRAWKHDTDVVYTVTATPTTSSKAYVPAATGLSIEDISAVGDESSSVTVDSVEYERYSTGDLSL